MIAVDPASALKAQSKTVALFVSDVHLHESLPRTTAAFLAFLRHHAMQTQQLYVLGDLFEYWAGDDDIDSPYNRLIVDALRAVSDHGVEIFWMAGNRDFLVGHDFARATGATLLADPSVIGIGDLRIVLAHGDAQCTDDLGYMQFRAQVREPAWQRDFLAMPLAQRKAIIDGMRTGSREAQRGKSAEIMDVNRAAIAVLFDTSGTALMIHGHTHRPAMHRYGNAETARIRHVLPDWECDIEPARGGWIAVTVDKQIMHVDLCDKV